MFEKRKTFSIDFKFKKREKSAAAFFQICITLLPVKSDENNHLLKKIGDKWSHFHPWAGENVFLRRIVLEETVVKDAYYSQLGVVVFTRSMRVILA